MQKILAVKMKVFYTHLVSSPSLEAQVLTSLTDLEPLPFILPGLQYMAHFCKKQ